MRSDRNRMHDWRTPGVYARGNAAVNITNNYTSVTNVTSVSGTYGRPYKRHGGHKHQKQRADRPPKLQRFCATGGLLDYNVAARMDSPELCVEAAKVVGYNAKGLARSLGNMGRDACGCAEGLFECATAIVRGVICLFK